MKKLVLYVAAGVLSGVWMSAQQLPIRRVLLYKNGMAYLVRSGSIEQPLRLTFHPHDMKDVLLSAPGTPQLVNSTRLATPAISPLLRSCVDSLSISRVGLDWPNFFSRSKELE